MPHIFWIVVYTFYATVQTTEFNGQYSTEIIERDILQCASEQRHATA